MKYNQRLLAMSNAVLGRGTQEPLRNASFLMLCQTNGSSFQLVRTSTNGLANRICICQEMHYLHFVWYVPGGKLGNKFASHHFLSSSDMLHVCLRIGFYSHDAVHSTKPTNNLNKQTKQQQHESIQYE